ncbi:hypothetical protein ACFUYE_00680 [Micromonospora humida]|uniref:hypothetical protein n=1 Tax=Micromonospora humida TaxID=2809018 RepID=UPI003670F51D
MTTAPANLLAVRRLLLDTIKGLDPAAVGIVGDPAHRGGYHCGSDRVVSNDYSVVESSRDRTGLTLYASGLDIGWFEVRVDGKTHNLYTFNRWMVAQLDANAPDSRDIREWIYTLDGKSVRRWDRLKRRTSGDKSHLYHSHGSFFRDSIKAGRDQNPLFRRYLTSIGLLAPTVEDDMFEPSDRTLLKEVHDALLNPAQGIDKRHVVQLIKDLAYVLVKGPTGSSAWVGGTLTRIAEAAGVSPAELEQITAAARAGVADLAPAILAQLDPARIAAAIPPTVAAQVVDELSARLGQARE